MTHRYHPTSMGRCGRRSVLSQGKIWEVIGDVQLPRARRRSLPMFAQVRRRRVPASYVATIARARRSQTQRRRHSSSAKAEPLNLLPTETSNSGHISPLAFSKGKVTLRRPGQPRTPLINPRASCASHDGPNEILRARRRNPQYQSQTR